MVKFLYSNQIQDESKVENGVFYSRDHPGGEMEAAFSRLLQAAMGSYDSRFKEGVSAYWTVSIRLARRNPGSKWYSYAITLPEGIQTIKRRKPTSWMYERVTGWSDVASFKVLVY